MAFEDITERLAAILEAERSTLISGLEKEDLPILAAMPHACFSDQALFVYRSHLPELSYGSQEIDGLGVWEVAVYVVFSGAEETAARELSKLAWNLLGVLYGYQQDTNWTSMMVTGSVVDQREYQNAWYLGERFTLRIKWSLIAS